MYPDFIGIGAQKAGTTWLSHNLQRHPEIWMPADRTGPLFEVHYFDEKMYEPANVVPRLFGRLSGKRIVDRRWRRQVKARMRKHLREFHKDDFMWDLRYYAGSPGDGWYASLFEPGRGKVVGEITPSYSMLDTEVVARVHEKMPRAKIIFMMRSPIERAWSQSVMHFGKNKKREMESLTDRELRRTLKREGSRSRTDYLRTLENWGAFYPEEQIFVGFLEDIHFYPGELLRGAYEFLGVDKTFTPPGVGKKVHARSTGRMMLKAAIYLAQLYREELSRLSEHFGGYASFWLFCAERLAEDRPEEGYLPYPLWDSAIWQEWIEDAGQPDYQSGPLSAVRLA